MSVKIGPASPLPRRMQQAIDQEDMDTVQRWLTLLNSPKSLDKPRAVIDHFLINRSPLTKGSFEEAVATLTFDYVRQQGQEKGWEDLLRGMILAASEKNAPQFLHWAEQYTGQHKEGGIQALIEDWNSWKGFPMACLHPPIAIGNQEILEWFLQRGVSPAGTSAWASALGDERAHLLPILHQYGDTFHCDPYRRGSTPLLVWVYQAAIRPESRPDTTASLNFFLNLGIDPTVKDDEGETAAELAITLGRPDLARQINAAIAAREAERIAENTQVAPFGVSTRQRI